MAKKKGKATAGLVLSVISLVLWLVPVLGILWLRKVQHSMEELI